MKQYFKTTNVTDLLFEKMPIDFKLLFEHDLPPIFNDECVRIQVLCCSEDLPVLLHPSYSPQLELQTTNHMQVISKSKRTLIQINDQSISEMLSMVWDPNY